MASRARANRRAARAGTVDIGRLLDDGPWSRLQKTMFWVAALAVLLDGFDSQLIGFAIPVIIKDWGVTRGDFAPVVACGLVGMSLGSLCAGAIGDRIGRRAAIVGSVLLFGVATSAIGFAPDLFAIGALRLVAGLGIGGALPIATTVTAEFTPARFRTMTVTGTIVCVPLGGMLAGLFAGQVLPTLGWRSLFWLGGLLPVVLSVGLWFGLPETPRFLARHAARWPELVALLGRMARPTPPEARFVDAVEQTPVARARIAALFAAGRARDTLALWGALFLCLLAVYSAFSWLPTMLSAQGLNVAVAGAGLTAYNFGGAIGSLACAAVITRAGSRGPQIACALGAAATALALQLVDLGDTVVLIVGLGLHGLFVNAVQSTLYAVAAHAYPTGIRATGTATALAFGRLGAILSAFVGAAVISKAGPGSFLSVLCLAMLGTAVCLALMRRHIPPRVASRAGEQR